MTDSSDISAIREQFQKIDASDARGDRRPHRPLLVLYALGKLEQGERDLSFEEIDQDFKDLLKEYGPPPKLL